MAELSLGERVLARALRLMANKGYCWSKAIDIAAESLEPGSPSASRRIRKPSTTEEPKQ